MKKLLLIFCLSLTQSAHSNVYRGGGGGSQPKTKRHAITVHSLSEYETYYNQADEPEHIHSHGLSLADYHALYRVAHGKTSAKKAVALLQNTAPKVRRKLYKRIKTENDNFLNNNDSAKKALCFYTKQQRRAMKLQNLAHFRPLSEFAPEEGLVAEGQFEMSPNDPYYQE